MAMALLVGALAQFDWGSGCGGGNGAPFSVTLPEGQSATVGTIPSGKWSVQIFLSSLTDVDVQLETASGEPLIAWCETRPSSRAAQITYPRSGSNPSLAADKPDASPLFEPLHGQRRVWAPADRPRRGHRGDLHLLWDVTLVLRLLGHRRPAGQ
jgi:hypothetical protein